MASSELKAEKRMPVSYRTTSAPTLSSTTTPTSNVLTIRSLAACSLWAWGIIRYFRLGVTPMITVRRLRGKKVFDYRPSPTGGAGIVIIDEDHLKTAPSWEVLGTLIFALLTAWQHHHGKPGKSRYPNAELRGKALRCGLFVDRRGRVQVLRGRLRGQSNPPPFPGLLKAYGFAVPAGIPAPKSAPPKKKTGPAYTRYECPCCGVRVHVETTTPFKGTCYKCSCQFDKQGPGKSTNMLYACEECGVQVHVEQLPLLATCCGKKLEE